MADGVPSSSPRQQELLERSYRYVLQHGLIDMSLRPLAEAIDSSPRVLLFLFGSKDGLVRALLARARQDELAMLQAAAQHGHSDLADAAAWLWEWLSDPQRRDLLYLWVEAYGRSLTTPQGAWGGFAEAMLHGALLDLLATGESARVTAAVRDELQALRQSSPGGD